MKTIQTIYDESKKRRVIIFQRDDGTFGFNEEKFSDEPLEKTWIPIDRRNSQCDTLEQVLTEIRGRVDWLPENSQ